MRAFVYRSLAFRLALAGVIISLIAAAAVYLTHYEDISDHVITDARNLLDRILYHRNQIASQQYITPGQAFEQTLAKGLPVRPRQP